MSRDDDNSGSHGEDMSNVRDRIDVLSKKLAMNIAETEKNGESIYYLKNENEYRKDDIEKLKEEINNLFKSFEDFSNYHENEKNNLKSELSKVKKNSTSGDGDNKRIKSNTSLCLLYTSPSPRDKRQSRMPSSA